MNASPGHSRLADPSHPFPHPTHLSISTPLVLPSSVLPGAVLDREAISFVLCKDVVYVFLS